jgi:hypothetical protein
MFLKFYDNFDPQIFNIISRDEFSKEVNIRKYSSSVLFSVNVPREFNVIFIN